MLIALTGCMTVKEDKQKPKEMQSLGRLLDINDLNERSFAYHHYCLSKTEPVNEQFLENFKATTDALFDECLETLKWEPQYIVDQVTKRRENLQKALSAHYLEKGCQSAEAVTAGDHYRSFSQLDSLAMERFISEN